VWERTATGMKPSPSSGSLAQTPRVAKVLPTSADDYNLEEEVRPLTLPGLPRRLVTTAAHAASPPLVIATDWAGRERKGTCRLLPHHGSP